MLAEMAACMLAEMEYTENILVLETCCNHDDVKLAWSASVI